MKRRRAEEAAPAAATGADDGALEADGAGVDGAAAADAAASSLAKKKTAVPKKFVMTQEGKVVPVAELEARTAAAAAADAAGPSSVLIQFQAMSDGAPSGPTLDVPVGVTPKQLELLVNSLLDGAGGGKRAGEPTPYSFYLNAEEITASLKAAMAAQALSPEAVHVVKYQPLAVFRVVPVNRCTDSMPGHTDAILHVSFSPDGRTLASGGGDATVRFWDAYSAMPRAVCTGHRHHVLCTAWSPDGSRFASADRSGEVRVWDPLTGKEACAPLTGHKGWVTALAWEPLHAATPAAGLPPSCELLATSSKDRTVRVWNTRTGRLQFSLEAHTDSVEAVRWGGTGLVYTASRDRQVLVWAVEGDKSRGKVVRCLAGHGHRINALALNTDALLRSGPWDHSGGRFATPQAAFDAAKARFEAGLAGMGGKELLVSCSDDFTLMLWDPSNDKKPVARMVGHQAPVNHLAFSPDGRYVASAGFDKKVKLWDGRSGKFLVNYNGHVGAVYQVAWSADSRYVASASKDSTVKIWPARVGGEGGAAKPHAVSTLAGHADEVYALDWAPNGEILASGSKDRLVKMWRN